MSSLKLIYVDGFVSKTPTNSQALRWVSGLIPYWRNCAMEMNEYQRLAMRTASGATTESSETYLDTMVLGLNGEAGEIAELFKKYRYHGHDYPDAEKLVKELGDILWYVACGAEGLGVSLNEIAKANIEKLKLRYPNRFSTEQSLNRPNG